MKDLFFSLYLIRHKWEWRIKYNDELYTLYKENDIVTYIKINRLRWAGHVIRLEEQSPTRRVLTAEVEGRSIGADQN
jgi:hypothetical protein